LLAAGGSYSAEKCQGNEVVDPKYFFPVSWIRANDLMEKKRKIEEWREVFKEAYSVDFYQSSVRNYHKVQRPQFYGADKPAYSYLAPNFCPLSYFSQRLF
jgi:hypothetical protein